MKQTMVTIKGEKAGEVTLGEKFFDVPWSPDLVHQVAVVQAANRRQVSASVKDRGDVRGGGKKPWRQKGTGRARHGSTRSPIWVGGGVTHGPSSERNYKRKLNVKMRRKALFSLLSEKLRNKQVLFVDAVEVQGAKTKELVAVLNALPLEGKSTLLVLSTMDGNVIRAANNIPYVKTIQAKDLSVTDVIGSTYLVMPQASVAVLEETFGT